MDRPPSTSIRNPGSRGTAAALLGALLAVAPWPAKAQPPSAPVRLPVIADPVRVEANDLDNMPDIGLDWPDLGADDPVITAEPDLPLAASEQPAGSTATTMLPVLPTEALEGEDSLRQAEQLSRIDPAQSLHYAVQLRGVDAIADTLFRTRFDALSELKKDPDEEANIAQITRRVRVDMELLDKLMRTRGYYDARVSYQLQARNAGRQQIEVDFDVVPDFLYKLTDVSVTGLSTDPREAAIRALFTTKVGDPADTDAILKSSDAMRTGLAEGGYPFGKVGEPELRIDHDDHAAELDVAVVTGGYRRYGRIAVSGDPPFDAHHIFEIARFRTGDPYKQTEMVDLQRALVATGLVASAEVHTAQAPDPDQVDLDIQMTKAPVHTIAGELGYGTGEGARSAISWQHRNLFPPEGALTLRGVLGTREQLASVAYRRNNFHSRDRVLNGELAFSNVDQDAYQATSLGISASLERQTNIIFQKAWTWSAGAELILSDERDLYGFTLEPRRRVYLIAATPLSLTYDGSNDLLDPSSGFRLGGRLSPELSLQNVTFGYVRAQIDASAYLPMSERLTLAGRFRIGTIVGASADRIAPTRRFYAGGGASVRGYSYQAIGPRDLNNDPVGGRSLAEVSIEARYRFGSARQFGIVPFIDAGTIDADPWPSIRELRVGAGIGVRYYTNFGPIRIDVGTPINPQPGDPRIGVYVSLGQAF